MAEWDDKLKEISNELNEHIMAVKGTLELIEVSSSEKELQALIVKAIERIDTIQRLSQETIVALKNCFDTIDEMKTQK
jgi:vacuolar-type H+-ATPase subunit I/STV1